MELHGDVSKKYRDWQVWQEAVEITTLVHRIETTDDRGIDMLRQLRRASLSVPANIGEGAGRGGKAGANHYRIAKGSLHEADTLVYLSQQLGYLDLMEEGDRERLQHLIDSAMVQLGLLLKKVTDHNN